MMNITTKYIIEKLRENSIYYFTPRILAGILKLIPSKVYPLFKRLKKAGFAVEVEKGKYFLLGFEKEKILSNPYFMANQLLYPSYISFWSALNFYGLTEQVPFTVFLASAIKKAGLEFNNYKFKFVKIAAHKFFGYQRVEHGDLPIIFAEPEKAIIDSLDQPQYAGGVSEIFKCLENARTDKKIKVAKLINYAIRMKNKTLCSRLGYLLEKLRLKNDKLRKYKSNTFVLLDVNKPMSKKWDKKWKININADDQELSAWKET